MQIAQTVKLYGVHRSASKRGATGSVGDKLAIICPDKDHHGDTEVTEGFKVLLFLGVLCVSVVKI